MARPLDGVRVLEWGSAHAGPGANYMMADMGADVIKLESRKHPDIWRKMPDVWAGRWGNEGPYNFMLDATHRNKRSVSLELEHEEGRDIFRKLVAKSDVFLTNYMTDSALAVGADYETLIKINPRMVYVSVSGTGLRGPYPEMRSFDMAAQALGGWMFQMGDRDREGNNPVYIVMGVLDQVCATTVLNAILAGLVTAQRTGKGLRIETSMMGAAIHAQALNIISAAWQGRPAARHARDRAPNVLGNHYACSDGKWILMSETNSKKYWPGFCDAIGKPHWANDPKFASVQARKENTKELIRALDEVFATKPREEWIKILNEKGGGFGFCWINSIMDVLEDPQAVANGYVTEMDYPGIGLKKAVGSPIRFFGFEDPPMRPTAEVGQHNVEVLSGDLGMSEKEIESLKKQGVI